MAHDASLLLFFFRFLAHSLVRRQNFIPIFIAPLHRIHLALVLRAVWVTRFVANP